jgi:hypothetical protein
MTDYYVDAANGSDANSGTADAPFATISQASSLVTAGSTVHVAPGVYAEEIQTTASGTADAPITFVSDTQGGAKIVPPTDGVTGDGWRAAGDYITIDGFEIDGANYQAGQIWNTGIYLTGSYDTATNCLVHNIALNDGDGHGAGGIVTDNYDGGVYDNVVGCVVHDVGNNQFDHGIYIGTSGDVVNNVVYNIASVGIHLWHNATNVNIENNTITNCSAGILVGGGDYYNGFEGPDDYTNVFNNIVYANDYGIEEEGNTGTHNTYVDNLVYDSTYADYRLQNGNTYSGNIAADPQLMYYEGGSGGDYQLAPTSPAIDAGVMSDAGVNAPTTDIDGNLRPSGATVDIGAYEYTDTAPCFGRGTLIRTLNGEVAVEELAIGDRIVTATGQERPIRWIGRRAYDGKFLTGNKSVLPVKIARGALTDGVPARDLTVSPEHALYIDGVLVPAELLLNGMTVTQPEAVESVEYFHIELDEHDIIFAQGTPSETYVDCDNRRMFANGAEYEQLYPDDTRPRWAFAAARLDWDSPELTAIRERMLKRATSIGHPGLESDPELHLVVDGLLLRPNSLHNRAYRFEVPAGAREVWLISRSTVPAYVMPRSRDFRRLGVPVECITLRDTDLSTEFSHVRLALGTGFHEDDATHCWTDGLARLPRELFRPFRDAFTLEVRLAPREMRYPALSPIGVAAQGRGTPGRRSGDPDLHLRVDGNIVRPLMIEDQVHRFIVPGAARDVKIVSRSCVPLQTKDGSLDPRRLGVAVEQLALSGEGMRIEIDPAYPALCDGFHGDEGSHRWTNGCGQFPAGLLGPFPSDVTVELRIGVTDLQYPVDDALTEVAHPQRRRLQERRALAR